MGRKPSGQPLIHRCAKIQKNGDVYVYERIRTLNPEKHGYDEKRTLLGILPPGSDDLYGELIPTRPKRTLGKYPQPEMFYTKKRTGMIDIIRFLSSESRLDGILRSILPQEQGLAEKILTCVWYNFATDGDTWPGITNWTMKYQGLVPYTYGPISRDMYHELFVELGRREDIRFQLFRKLGEYLTDESMLALDSSTFDTESENLANARKAVHKDGLIKKLYKIVFFYAIDSRKPVAYSLIPGNIPDSQTVSNALRQVEGLNFQKMEIVSDNGYCTAAAIAAYLKKGQAFLTRIEADIKWISEVIEMYRDELEHGGDILESDPKFSGCVHSVKHTFQKQETVNGKRETESIRAEVRVFIYYSSVNKAKDDVYFRERYGHYKEDLLHGRYLGKEKKAVESFARKYMEVEYGQHGGITKIVPKEEACRKALKYSGYLVLVSNKEENADKALERFRKREYIEEDIKNFKGHTGGRKPRVWNDDTLDGEILIHFLSLILHETYELRVQKMKEQLALPDAKTGEVLDMERQLLTFLRKTSLHDQLHWFDALVTREYMEAGTGSAWNVKAETTKRDQMYLKMLGLTPNNIDSE